MRLRRYVIVHHRGRKDGQATDDPVTLERRFFFRLHAEKVADRMTLNARRDGLWTGDWYDVEP